LARVMNRGALAEDAVSVRRLRAGGVFENAVRRQLAGVPVPATRRLVFVRRVILRTRPDQVGRAMTTALAQLAEDSRSEMLAFADVSHLVVACARAASSGGLGAGVGGGWHWRAFGLSRTATPGEAVGTLLAAYPLEAAAATAALAANGLLAPVWRDLSEPAAARLTAALGEAGRFSPPGWPADGDETPPDWDVTDEYEPLLAHASAFWSPVLRALPRRHEAVRTAGTLSLLRWSPMSLQAPSGPLWPLLLARIVGADSPAERASTPGATTKTPAGASAASESAPDWSTVEPGPNAAIARLHGRAVARSEAPLRGPGPDPGPVSSASIGGAPITSAPIAGAPITSALVAGANFLDAATPIDSRPHGEVVSTGWGGLFFLVNALNRLDIAARLAAYEPTAPSGWRVLLDLGLAFGMPEDEPLAEFLAAQDLAPPPPPSLCPRIVDDMQALYAPHSAWPPPLAQSARLLANETHLDVDILTERVDIDIRRVGLDIDPGWVPWLGRIVTFHYPNLTAVHLGEA